jgi:outer membrane protein
MALAEQRVLEAHLSDMSERARRGLANRLDLDEVEARLDALKAQVAQANAAREEALGTLKKLSGVRVSTLYVLRDNIPMPLPEPASSDEWEEVAATHSPDVKSADASAQQAKAEYQRQFSEMLPKLDLHMTDTQLDSGNSLFNGGSLTSQKLLTLRLTVPLLNPQGLGYPEAAGMAKWRQSEFARDAELLDIRDKVHSAYEEAVTNAERSTILASALEHQERVTEARRTKVLSGVGTETDFLDAERDRYKARRELLGARYNYLLNMMQLRRYVGVISREDVAYVNDLLNLPPVLKTEQH